MVQFQHSYSLFTTSHLNNIYFSYISTYLFVLLSISGPVCVNNSSSDSYYTTYSTAQALYATLSVKNTQSRFPKRILSWVNFAVDESRLKLPITVVVLKGGHVSCHGCTDKEKETYFDTRSVLQRSDFLTLCKYSLIPEAFDVWFKDLWDLTSFKHRL